MTFRSVFRFAVVAGVLAASAGFAVPAFARAEAMTATLSSPLASPARVITGTMVWACEGTTCRTSAERALNVRACRQLVREVGPVASFGAASGALTARDITSCNAAARPR
ncbi:MAG: CC_3452 family protein [Caulobacterales bacterium]|jgi:hypothetical protein